MLALRVLHRSAPRPLPRPFSNYQEDHYTQPHLPPWASIRPNLPSSPSHEKAVNNEVAMKVSVDKGVAAGVQVEPLLPEGQKTVARTYSSLLGPLCVSIS